MIFEINGTWLWAGWMTVGKGMALFKDVEISKIDAQDCPVLMDQFGNKWIDINPEKDNKQRKN